MKKFLIPLFVCFLPIAVIASILNIANVLRLSQPEPCNRAFRLQQQIFNSSQGSQWVPTSRAVMHYNSPASAAADSMQMDVFDSESGEWMPRMMVGYITYNQQGLVIDNTIYMNYFGYLMPMMKSIATYDDENRITGLFAYEGGTFPAGKDSEEWAPFSRLHIFYDGQAVSDVYGWEQVEEELRTSIYFHSTFETDINGRIITEFTSESADSSSWVNDDKIERTYHPNDNTTGMEFINYMSRNLPFMIMNDGFDFPGMITEEIEYDLQDSNWIQTDKNESSFNGQDQKVQTTYYYWDLGHWNENNRKLFHYDNNGNLNNIIEQENSGEGLIDYQRTDYIWETFTGTNTPESSLQPDLSLTVYPSPFFNDLNIYPQSKINAAIPISIFNLKGQLVRSFNTQSGTTITWDGTDMAGRNLSTGIYFIRSWQNGQTVTRKVVKIR